MITQWAQLTEAKGDLDLERDLQKVPQTTEFNIHIFGLTSLFQKPRYLFHVMVTILNRILFYFFKKKKKNLKKTSAATSS